MVPVSAYCPVCASPSTTHAFDSPDLALAAVPGCFRYSRCSDCSSVFADPQPEDELLYRAYTSSYGNYKDDMTFLERILTSLSLPEANRLISHTSGSGRLIELGAGNGRFLERLRRCGWQGSLEGVEFEQRVAAATTERTGIAVRTANIEDEVLEKESYDVIVLRHVIEHLRNPLAMLDSIRRALRPGGVLFVGTPDTSALCAHVFGRHWWGYEVPRHLVVFSRTALLQTLSASGFTPVDHWSGFSPQMWNASLALLLRDRHGAHWWHGALTSTANPLATGIFSVVSLFEARLGRSTMLNVVARRC